MESRSNRSSKSPSHDWAYITRRDRTRLDFPVLSAGPTPHTPLDAWTFALEAEDGTKILSWSWEEFRALGPTEVTVDIHCVTRWSKFDTDRRGISVDRIFAAAGLEEPSSPFVMAFCDGGYTSNLPVLQWRRVSFEIDRRGDDVSHSSHGAAKRNIDYMLCHDHN